MYCILQVVTRLVNYLCQPSVASDALHAIRRCNVRNVDGYQRTKDTGWYPYLQSIVAL